MADHFGGDLSGPTVSSACEPGLILGALLLGFDTGWGSVRACLLLLRRGGLRSWGLFMKLQNLFFWRLEKVAGRAPRRAGENMGRKGFAGGRKGPENKGPALLIVLEDS